MGNHSCQLKLDSWGYALAKRPYASKNRSAEVTLPLCLVLLCKRLECWFEMGVGH